MSSHQNHVRSSPCFLATLPCFLCSAIQFQRRASSLPCIGVMEYVEHQIPSPSQARLDHQKRPRTRRRFPRMNHLSMEQIQARPQVHAMTAPFLPRAEPPRCRGAMPPSHAPTSTPRQPVTPHPPSGFRNPFPANPPRHLRLPLMPAATLLCRRRRQRAPSSHPIPC